MIAARRWGREGEAPAEPRRAVGSALAQQELRPPTIVPP